MAIKSKVWKLLGASLLSVGAVSVCAAVVAHTFNKETKEAQALYTPNTHYEVSDTASELTSYYSSISSSATGTTLLSQLQSLNSSKRKKTMGYSTMNTSVSNSPYIYTDYVLSSSSTDSNGQRYGTSIASFYTKTSATSWNREHMWPNSRGGSAVEGDILHTRPTISSENSSRGNSFYVEGMNNSSNGWDPYTAGYEEWVRGECARTILYCVVANSSFSLSDASAISSGQTGYSSTMGDMDTLIKWHFAYTPNEYEINRNNGAEYLQGNRNPFVDHPEYVAKIWSNFNTNISTICSNNSSTYSNWTVGSYSTYGTNDASSGGSTTAPTSLTMSQSTASVGVGGTVTLSVTPNPSSSSSAVNWSSSNTSVATVNNGVVTGVAGGTATITATSKLNSSVKCSATITVLTVSTLSYTGSPTKTSYNAGDSFNPSGLTVTAKFSDNSTSNVTSSVTWSPDPLTAGTTSVTGSYGGKTVTVNGITVAASSNATIVPTDLDSSYPTTAKDYTSATGNLKFKAYNTANFSSKVQFKKSGGYIYNTQSLTLGSITINDMSGTLTVYGGTSSNPSSTTVTGSSGTYNMTGYSYFKIINSSSSVATASSITVTLSSGATASISLNKTEASINVDESVTLTATATGGSGSVTWAATAGSSYVSLSATTGSSISVTGLAAGSATITASYSGQTATCTITVTTSGGGAVIPESTYTFTSATTTYNSSLTTAQWSNTSYVAGFDSSVFTVNTSANIRQGSNGNSSSAFSTSDFMFYPGSGTTTLSIALNSSDYIVSKVQLTMCKNLSTESPVISCGGLVKEVTDLKPKGTYTFYPLQQSFTIEVVTARVFVSSIVVNVTEKTNEHLAWGQSFLEMTQSECTAGSGISSSTWSDCSTVFGNVSSDGQVDICYCVANKNGNACEEAVARYDNILANYTSLSDFLARGNSANSMKLMSNNNNIVIYSVICSIVALLSASVCFYFIRKKRKER